MEVMQMKLEIEMIPKTSHGNNLRSMLKKSDWDKIRKAVYTKENMFCHICGEEQKSLDAHEMWEFDEENHFQTLVDIIGICKPCHNTIHFGRAQKIGAEDQAIDQFMKVNKCDYEEFEIAKFKAADDYFRRSKISKWKLDVSFIENYGFSVLE